MKKTVGKNVTDAAMGPVEVGKWNSSGTLFRLELRRSPLQHLGSTSKPSA